MALTKSRTHLCFSLFVGSEAAGLARLELPTLSGSLKTNIRFVKLLAVAFSSNMMNLTVNIILYSSISNTHPGENSG